MHIVLAESFKDSSLYNVVSLILMFIFVLFLAYMTAKLSAKLQGNTLNKKANIKIVDSLRLGGNKFISIVKIGEKYYALGFGKDEITLIDKLDETDLSILETTSNVETKSFKDVLYHFSKEKNNTEKNNTEKSR